MDCAFSLNQSGFSSD